LDAKYSRKGAYLYSQAIDMPEIPTPDFLFKPSVRPAAATLSPAAVSATSPSSFTLGSPVVANGGRLPKEFTGDGASATPPLEWSSPPAGTKSFALVMHHLDPEGKTKWYWTLYNIPADVRSLSSNVQGVGTLGNNSVNGRTEYAPPHSKRSRDKTYTLTLYALSAPLEPEVSPAEVSRDVLLAAMKDKLLAASEMQVVYAREGSVAGQGN